MRFPFLRQTAINWATKGWTGIRKWTPVGTIGLESRFASPAESGCFQSLTPPATCAPAEEPLAENPGVPRTPLEDDYLRRLDRMVSHTHTEPYGYYALEGATFWSPFGVVEAGGQFFPGAYPSPAVFSNPRYGLPQVALPYCPASDRHGDAFLLGGPWVHNYYHVLIDYLPRLLQLDGMTGGGTIPIAVPDAGLAGVIRQALDALSMPNPVLSLAPGRHRFDRLILPHRISGPMDVSPLVGHFADTRLGPALLRHRGTATSGRRIYISRQDARSRRLLNEDDLIARLSHLGFDCVTLSGLSLQDQAALFSSADIVVASHGAALANLIFSRPGTRFLEIFGDGFIAAYFRQLGRRRGLHYDLLVGDQVGLDVRIDTGRVAARMAALAEDVAGPARA